MTSSRKLPEPPRYSVFTPFVRRFTDERARDLKELHELYNEVRALHGRSRYNSRDALVDIAVPICEGINTITPIPDVLLRPLVICVKTFVEHENYIFEFPYGVDIGNLTLKEGVDLKRFLLAKQYFHRHEEIVIDLITDALETLFTGILLNIPEIGEHSLFSTSVINLMPEPKANMGKMVGTLADDRFLERGLFADFAESIYYNICAFERLDPNDDKTPGRIIGLADLKEPPQEVFECFNGTPLYQFLNTSIPLNVTFETFFEHMHVVGGSGAGKTQWLQSLILHHLKQENPPALVVVDSQGDLINKLSRLSLFDPDGGPLADRFVHITPKDVDYPPAINIFDVKRERVDRYDKATREQVVAGVIDTFDYLFRGLLADLTAKQSVFFRMVARLMLAARDTMDRNATILDILDLIDSPANYQPAIEALPEIHRRFFERDFNERTFNQTREQIRYRLNAILENPTLYRLFTAPETKVDIFNELNHGSIILVDTAKDFLKSGSSYFGRIFISLVLQAVYERAAIPERKRKPAFLVVDEAADYFDTNIDDLLTEARKYRLGCVFAHQYLDQCTQQLRSSLAANTSIKMASGVSTSDARRLAPDLRTTPEFIIEQQRLHFATHIRGVTNQAISLPVTPGVLEQHPAISESGRHTLRESNRKRVSISVSKPQIRPAPQSTPQAPDEPEDEWKF